MSSSPLISVIIPAYNAAEYLEEAVVSILQQTYSGFEIIIVDHNSNDGTAIVAARLAKLDNRISVYKITQPGNAAVSRNFGIKQAKCEYIAFLDADDIWHKDKLWLQIEAYAYHPYASFIYTASATFGAVSYFSPLYEILPLPWKAARSHTDLLKGNPVTCSSVLTKRESVIAAGYFDENPDNKSEDYDLWLKLSQTAPMVFIPKILVDYRIHDQQFSNLGNTRTDRLTYIRKKWNLTAVHNPSYRTNVFLRIIRNTLHLFAMFLYKSGFLATK